MMFSRVGMNEFINEEMHEKIKRFVRHIYGKKFTSRLNELRYQIYCQRGRKIPCELICQARVCRGSLDPYFAPPSAIGHGWKLDDEGNIDINWICKCSIFHKQII